MPTPSTAMRTCWCRGFYTGSMMMRLSADRPSATLLWKDEGTNRILEDGVEVAEADGLHSNITTPLIVGDTIYGIGSHGHVRGLRAETGERIWEAEGLTTRNRWGSAHFVRHEDRYFVYNENGELIIARFAPEGYAELDRTHVLNPTSRTGYGPSAARQPVAKTSRAERPPGRLVPSGLRQPPRRFAERRGDHPGYRWTRRTIADHRPSVAEPGCRLRIAEAPGACRPVVRKGRERHPGRERE